MGAVVGDGGAEGFDVEVAMSAPDEEEAGATWV